MTGLTKNISRLINLLLCKFPIARIDRVPNSWEDSLIIATPSLRCEEDMLELFSARDL